MEKENKQLEQLQLYLRKHPEAKAEGYLKTTGDMFAKIVKLVCNQFYKDLDLDCNSLFDKSLKRHSQKPSNIEYSKTLTDKIFAGVGVRSNTFEYGGYHFTPYRKFRKSEGDFFDVSQRMRSDRGLALCTYDWRKADYCYDSFYEASADKSCDIFRCEENGKLYIPCLNELFEYQEPKQRRKSPKQRQSAMDALDNAKEAVEPAPPVTGSPDKSHGHEEP